MCKKQPVFLIHILCLVFILLFVNDLLETFRHTKEKEKKLRSHNYQVI